MSVRSRLGGLGAWRWIGGECGHGVRPWFVRSDPIQWQITPCRRMHMRRVRAPRRARGTAGDGLTRLVRLRHHAAGKCLGHLRRGRVVQCARGSVFRLGTGLRGAAALPAAPSPRVNAGSRWPTRFRVSCPRRRKRRPGMFAWCSWTCLFLFLHADGIARRGGGRRLDAAILYMTVHLNSLRDLALPATADRHCN